MRQEGSRVVVSLIAVAQEIEGWGTGGRDESHENGEESWTGWRTHCAGAQLRGRSTMEAESIAIGTFSRDCLCPRFDSMRFGIEFQYYLVRK